MTTKRKRSTAPTPITGTATGNLGTAANLDDTQVLKAEDLDTPARGWLDDDARDAGLSEMPLPESEPAPPVAPVGPVSRQPSPRRGPEPLDRRRGIALVRVGAFATLIVLAGAGMLSRLDLGASGAEPTAPGFGVASFPATTTSPEPQPTDPGKGNCNGHGKHCRGEGGGD